MPVPRRVLSMTDVRCFVDEHCFPTRSGGGMGVELEWLAVDVIDRSRRASLERINQALVGLALPGGSRLTIEPGGQVELSSPPTNDHALGTSALTEDMRVVTAALSESGV